MSAGETKSMMSMFGEFMREAGVLFLVFGILDGAFEIRRAPNESDDLIRTIPFVAAFSFLIWWLGASIELQAVRIAKTESAADE